MPYCSQCRRSDITDHWEFCPRCGSALTPGAGAGADRPNDVKDVLVGFALDMAQSFVKSRIQRKFAPFAQLIDQTLGPGTPVSSASWPEWYGAAVREQQPTMDAADLARLQAEEITQARNATQMAMSAIEQSKSMNSILSRGRD